MVVYLDVLIIVNLILNYSILRACAFITGHKITRMRFLFAALAGSAYAALTCLMPWDWLATFPIKLLVGVGMSLIAYGAGKQAIRKTLAFLGVSSAFAGIAFGLSYVAADRVGLVRGNVYINITLPILLMSAAVAYGLLTLIFRPALLKDGAERKILIAVAGLKGQVVKFPVLVDTGCSLLDPITNREVIVANIEGVEKLLGMALTREFKKGTDPADILTRYAGTMPMRLIFCKNVTGTSDMLLAFSPDSIVLEGEDYSGALIAVTVNGLDGADGVKAIVGASAGK